MVIEIIKMISHRPTVSYLWFWRYLVFLVAFQFLKQTVENLSHDGKLTTGSPLQYESSWWTTIAFASFGVCFLLGGFLLLKYWLNFCDLKAGQKGNALFTTFQELKQQYHDVPDRKGTYNGFGGVPIGRYCDCLYIDDSAVNNLVIGTTRSGKGEAFVFSTGRMIRNANRCVSASNSTNLRITRQDLSHASLTRNDQWMSSASESSITRMNTTSSKSKMYLPILIR